MVMKFRLLQLPHHYTKTSQYVFGIKSICKMHGNMCPMFMEQSTPKTGIIINIKHSILRRISMNWFRLRLNHIDDINFLLIL
jgi:hypothetical protein